VYSVDEITIITPRLTLTQLQVDDADEMARAVVAWVIVDLP
jgi:hypothetical protein